MNLSQRVASVQPSATLAISAKAKTLRAQGVDIINLSVGEPDFQTPEHICQAGIDAIQAGQTKYTLVDGLVSLREAICDKLKRDNDLDYSHDEILVSNGAKQNLFNACQVLLNPGDEAIIPTPYWVSYPAMVQLAEGVPVTIATDKSQSFKITAQQLEQAITHKTRVFFLNSPSNPTGMCYSFDELKAIGDVLSKHPNIYILSDEIYEHIRWSNKPCFNLVNACPELKDRVVIVNGASKAYAMTGWRIGFSAANKDLTKAMKKMQSHATSGACSISQHAAIAAFAGDQHCIETMRQAYARRHDLVHQALNDIPGVECIRTDGAFYLFPDCQGLIKNKGLRDDIELCNALIEQAHIAPIPGSAFGAPGYLRFSTATSDEQLTEAMQRLKTWATA